MSFASLPTRSTSAKRPKSLHLSQPAVTSQVRSLEEGLGIALFDRVGRNATLTPAGKTLLPYVRQIETLTSDAVAALAPFGVQEGVELNIGASHTIGVYLLPKLLPMLVRDWPKLRIHVVSGSTTEILNALATHQVSIGLIEAPGHRPDLKIEAFSEDELSSDSSSLPSMGKENDSPCGRDCAGADSLAGIGFGHASIRRRISGEKWGPQPTTAYERRYEFDRGNHLSC